MNKIEAVIFDMDGVLVNSEPFHIEIEKRMFKKMGIDISDEEHAGYMGTATDVMWTQIIQGRNISLDVSEVTQLTIAEGLLFFNNLENLEPMTGIVDVLKVLTEKEIPMSVASSSDPETIRIMLEKSGLRKYFTHVISSSEVGKSKPAPDVFLYAAQLMGKEPENCIVVEDSKNGIQAAKTAGMYCVAYSGAAAENQEQGKADVIIDDYAELKKMLIKAK